MIATQKTQDEIWRMVRESGSRRAYLGNPPRNVGDVVRTKGEGGIMYRVETMDDNDVIIRGDGLVGALTEKLQSPLGLIVFMTTGKFPFKSFWYTKPRCYSLYTLF